MNGEIFILEFTEDKKDFDLIVRFNYADFFSGIQKNIINRSLFH